MAQRKNGIPQYPRRGYSGEIYSFLRKGRPEGQQDLQLCVYKTHSNRDRNKAHERQKPILNRFLARRELIERIERLSGKLTNEDIKRLKAKKQKQKRQKRAALKYKTPATNVASQAEGDIVNSNED